MDKRLMNLHAKELAMTSCAGRVRTGVVRHLLMLIAALMVCSGAAVSTSDGNLNGTSENKTSQEDKEPKLTILEELELRQKLPVLKDIGLKDIVQVLWDTRVNSTRQNKTQQIDELKDYPESKGYLGYLQYAGNLLYSYLPKKQVFWIQMTYLWYYFKLMLSVWIYPTIVLGNNPVLLTLVRTRVTLSYIAQTAVLMMSGCMFTTILLILQCFLKELLVIKRILTSIETVLLCVVIVLIGCTIWLHKSQQQEFEHMIQEHKRELQELSDMHQEQKRRLQELGHRIRERILRGPRGVQQEQKRRLQELGRRIIQESMQEAERISRIRERIREDERRLQELEREGHSRLRARLILRQETRRYENLIAIEVD